MSTPSYTPRTRKRARALRKEATFPERLLWSRLRRRQLGTKFLRQQPLGIYIADFYAPQAQLVVELDGLSHDATRADHDLERQRWMEARGMVVVRFSNDEVLRDLDGVVRILLDLLESP